MQVALDAHGPTAHSTIVYTASTIEGARGATHSSTFTGVGTGTGTGTGGRWSGLYSPNPNAAPKLHTSGVEHRVGRTPCLFCACSPASPIASGLLAMTPLHLALTGPPIVLEFGSHFVLTLYTIISKM